MRSNTGAPAAWGCPVAVRLKTVWSATPPVVPKGVTNPPVVRSTTCAGPGAGPSVAVAETIPLASDVDVAPLSDTPCEVSQITATFGTGRPEASSTRAVSGAGNRDAGGPDWLSPPRIRSAVADEPWGGVTVVPLTVRLKV